MVGDRMSSLDFKVCDITMVHYDAIVNAANSTLLGGGGVDGAIHRAAGPQLVEECRTLHGCKTGEAKITLGYNLPSKHVIHTVGPVYPSMSPDEAKLLLTACYRNSLDVAKKNNLHSVAFSAISTGVYGYPIDDAAEVAMNTVANWLEDDYQIDVLMTCFDNVVFSSYQRFLQEYNGNNKYLTTLKNK